MARTCVLIRRRSAHTLARPRGMARLVGAAPDASFRSAAAGWVRVWIVDEAREVTPRDEPLWENEFIPRS